MWISDHRAGLVNLIPNMTTLKGREAIQKYRDQGFQLHHHCTQMEHHNLVPCHTGRPSAYKLPDGTRMETNARNPYCQRRIRDLEDGLGYSMSFKRGKEVEAHNHRVQWRLCMMFEGREGLDKTLAHGSSLGARQIGWVVTEDGRQ